MISINILHGLRSVTDDDRDRARAAASAVLQAAGTTPAAAFAEFKRQWEILGSDESADAGIAQDYANLTGLAAIWVEADTAADMALTQGWRNPNGAACTISA